MRERLTRGEVNSLANAMNQAGNAIIVGEIEKDFNIKLPEIRFASFEEKKPPSEYGLVRHKVVVGIDRNGIGMPKKIEIGDEIINERVGLYMEKTGAITFEALSNKLQKYGYPEVVANAFWLHEAIVATAHTAAKFGARGLEGKEEEFANYVMRDVALAIKDIV